MIHLCWQSVKIHSFRCNFFICCFWIFKFLNFIRSRMYSSMNSFTDNLRNRGSRRISLPPELIGQKECYEKVSLKCDWRKNICYQIAIFFLLISVEYVFMHSNRNIPQTYIMWQINSWYFWLSLKYHPCWNKNFAFRNI